MPRPSHLSHSQVSSWLRCGKAYQLQRLQGAPEQPTVYLPAGTAIHTAIELMTRAWAEGKRTLEVTR